MMYELCFGLNEYLSLPKTFLTLSLSVVCVHKHACVCMHPAKLFKFCNLLVVIVIRCFGASL